MFSQVKAKAGTYYVATNGNDNWAGSEESPWKTIQHAAQTVVAGDVVYIKAGTYNESVSVAHSGTSNSYIVFSAYPGDEGLVVITHNTFEIVGKSYIKVVGLVREYGDKGFYVEGPSDGVMLIGNSTYETTSSGIGAWGVPWGDDPGNYSNIHNLVIKNNIIEKACDGGWNECITLANGVDGFEIAHNTIKNGGDPTNGGEGIDIKEGTKNGTIAYNSIYGLTRRGIYLDGGGLLGFTPPVLENIQIYGNIVHDNADAAIAIMTEGDGSVHNVQIYNNILYNQDDDGVMFYNHPAGTGNIYDITTINNTIYSNGRYGILNNFSTSYDMVVRNNICYQNASADIYLQSGSSTSDHNLTGTDPVFANASTGDFHIQSGSPAIDAGSATEAPSTDFDGVARAASVDIGAFEYVTDAINSAQAPTKVGQTGTYNVIVNYDASTSRDIHVDFQNTTSYAGFGGSSGYTVSAASGGTVVVPVTVASNPSAGSDYRWNIYMTPVGANWTQQIGSTVFVDPVSVTAGIGTQDSINSASSSSTVAAGGTLYVTVNYETTMSRDIHVDVQNMDDWTVYGGSVQTVSGSADASNIVPVTINSNAPSGSNYRLNIYITAVGGSYPNVLGNTYFYGNISVY